MVMASRPTLQTVLTGVMGQEKVYQKPPTNPKMNYPCVKYDLDAIKTFHADNKKYNGMKAYTVILMDFNPNSEYFDKILELPYCSFDRFYTINNLNHFVFTIYN